MSSLIALFMFVQIFLYQLMANKQEEGILECLPKKILLNMKCLAMADKQDKLTLPFPIQNLFVGHQV